MATYEIAPGSILQRLYITERLRKYSGQLHSFIELGSGNGYNSHLLLNHDLIGTGIDLNESACENNRILNKEFIQNNSYEVLNTDFFSWIPGQPVDLLFSCMVIEHLPDNLEKKYFEKAKEVVKPGGLIITLVPASMAHWGIEDDIAGHVRRYSRERFRKIAADNGLELIQLKGLTYPVSNLLLPVSNYIIRRAESGKKNLPMQEQTVLSGNRKVKFKTDYPWWMKLFLNKVTMYPFHLLQKLFGNSGRSLILYAEMRIPR